MFLGAGRLTIASIFSGSGLIPFALTILPKTLTSDLLNSHLPRFKVMFDSADHFRTACKFFIMNLLSLVMHKHVVNLTLNAF